MVTTAVLTILLCAGCTSPGSPFGYKDVKVSAGPSTSPAQPVVGQATTISFTIRNTWNNPLSGVTWELWETGSSPAMVTSGTVDIVAFGSTARTHVIASPTKGSHTYEVRVDTAAAIVEDDETNNTSGSLTVLVADQDIAFSASPAPSYVLGSPAATSPITLNFTLTNTVNPAQTVLPAAVSVPISITLNGSPISPTSTTPAFPVSVAPNSTTAVTVTLPPTNSAGTFVYTITLSPAVGDDSNTANNTANVTVVIPASG
jgi:hypothetical protein